MPGTSVVGTPPTSRDVRDLVAIGTKLTSRDVCYSSAYEAEADMPNNPADFR
jgi:hypothetical protein